MKKEISVDICYHQCPFFGNSMDGMYCGHPFWNDKEVFSNMIITHENSHHGVPEKCPLKVEPLTIKYKLRS